MAMQYKTIFIGSGGGVDVDKADVGGIATELGKYLKSNGMQAQGIKLPGLKKAQKVIGKGTRGSQGMMSREEEIELRNSGQT